MRGSRKNKVGATQLLDVPEALELRGVDDPNKQGMQFNVPMNRIIKNLWEKKQTTTTNLKFDSENKQAPR